MREKHAAISGFGLSAVEHKLVGLAYRRKRGFRIGERAL
jgi:hypothetical protein